MVVAEKRSKMGAPPVEDVGSYNSFSKAVNVKKERVLHWIERGAKPTPTVHNLLVATGTLLEKKISILLRKRKPKKGEGAAESPATAPAAKAA